MALPEVGARADAAIKDAKNSTNRTYLLFDRLDFMTEPNRIDAYASRITLVNVSQILSLASFQDTLKPSIPTLPLLVP